jgi:catechol 2,3-dioxygenase-like lactoylglutathione lyase family enzyme
MATNGATTARVAVVSVPASDQERARRFHVDQLGFDVVVDNDAVPGMD